jgi:hypothetical protein
MELKDHISRMASTRLVKIAPDKASKSKRNTGRPKKIWRQSLETG